ncbi:MAG: gamma-glutamyltransferase [Calditrichia bacterium]
MSYLTKNRTTVLIMLILFGQVATAGQTGHNASGKNGVVVAGKPEAVNAGLRMLESGGNAADGAAAAILMLAVKHVGAFCMAGEVPVIIHSAATHEVKVLSGQGEAPLDPQAIDWYMKNGIPGNDIRAAAVPATIGLCVTFLQKYGTVSFEQAVTPTLEILDAGGPTWYVDTSDGDTIETGTNWYADLARTLRKLVEAEKVASGDRVDRLQAVADRFYRGDIADELEAWYISQGGFLRKRDLAAHVTHIEDPLSINYKGYTVYKCGPWTQGPYMLQSLRLLEGFDLKKMGFMSADYVHVITEAMKLGLADRDEYYGDPLFVDVPMQQLLSDAYTNLRRPLIDMQKASMELRPGDPINMKAVRKTNRYTPWPGGTTTLCVADRWGNVVAATPSGLGSTAGPAGDTGIIHGTRLVSLNTWKGHPDCIEPGKRPRITLTPTLVEKDGKPVLAISVAGGDLQDQVALQLFLDYVEFGMTPSKAVPAPRFATAHHIGSFGQDPPRLGSLTLNKEISAKAVEILKSRGHKIRMTSHGIGGVAMLYVDSKTGECEASGSAAGAASK